MWGMDLSRVNHVPRRPSCSGNSEGNMSVIVMRDGAAPPWSEAISRMESIHQNLGGLALGHKPAVVRVGKVRSRSR